MKVWPYLIVPLRVFVTIMVLAWSYDNQMGWVDEYDMMAQCILGLYILLRSDREFRRQSKRANGVTHAAHYEIMHDLAMDNLFPNHLYSPTSHILPIRPLLSRINFIS